MGWISSPQGRSAENDQRDQGRVTHLLPDILRARIFAIAYGYEDADDLESSRQHPEWKPVVWLTSEPDVDRGRVPDEPPIIYVRITVVVKSTDRRLMPRQKALRQRFQAMHPGEPYLGDPPFDDDRWRHWWAYDGEITPWREVGIVAGGGAWWWLTD